MIAKLFNKKTMIAYTITLCVCFVFSCVMLGFNIHFSNEFKKATASSTDAKEIIANVLSSFASSLTGNKNNSSDNATDSKNNGYDEKTNAILTKKNVTGGFTITGFALTAVFMAGAITSSEYDKYLQSDKYKAKLKRLEKAKKAQAKAK